MVTVYLLARLVGTIVESDASVHLQSAGWTISYSPGKAEACELNKPDSCITIYSNLPAGDAVCSYVEHDIVAIFGRYVTYRTRQECMGLIPPDASTRLTTLDLATGRNVALPDLFGREASRVGASLRSERGHCEYI